VTNDKTKTLIPLACVIGFKKIATAVQRLVKSQIKINWMNYTTPSSVDYAE